MRSPDGVRVLHVEDDTEFAELAATFLEREHDRMTVETARNAEEGLARLDEETFDCIVSDYDLPGRNGIEFLEAVRETDSERPFILFTGKGGEAVASDAISAGVTDYLQKETGTEQYAILANRISNAVERARAEQARQRHLEAIETAREGISILNEDGEFIYVNEAYAGLYGYEREELLGEHWRLLYPDGRTREISEEILPRVEAEGHWRGETTGLRADGSTFVEDHTLATTEHGELVCTVLDASERARREHAIEELHSTARAFIRAETTEEVAEIAVGAVLDILDMPGTGIHLYDEAEGGLVPVAWTERTEDLVGEPPTFTPGSGLAWQAFESGEPMVYGDISGNDDRYNSETPVRSQILLPLDEHGVLLIGATEPDAFEDTDVSLARTVATHATAAMDRVEREQELARQNERLELFASVVSHDLRNPLNVALGNVELAAEDLDEPRLDTAERALNRTSGLLDDLQAFAQAGATTLDVEPVALAAVCERGWQHVGTGEATLEIETERTIRADASRLQELVENLFRNAVEHGSSSDPERDRSLTVTVGDLDAGFYVEDDGPGIPEEEREQVFERGFSTSERGTGFGLAIVREIAEAHGWAVSVTESEAGGARFELTGVETADW